MTGDAATTVSAVSRSLTSLPSAQKPSQSCVYELTENQTSDEMIFSFLAWMTGGAAGQLRSLWGGCCQLPLCDTYRPVFGT